MYEAKSSSQISVEPEPKYVYKAVERAVWEGPAGVMQGQGGGEVSNNGLRLSPRESAEDLSPLRIRVRVPATGSTSLLEKMVFGKTPERLFGRKVHREHSRG